MGGSRRLVTTLLSAAMLLAGAIAAQAMVIEQYDTMASPDQKEYVLQLIDGAQNVLRAEGRPDMAAQVARLFTTNDPESNVSIGMTQFDIALAKARVADLQRIKKDPNATRLEIEHAMIVVLKQSGITLPPAFMHVGDKFRPKLPLRY